jgi:pyridoxine/pyridoxamine 5'-phosphate oxidase
VGNFKTFLRENEITDKCHKNSVESDNKFRDWLSKQSEAVKEAKELSQKAKTINEKYRKAWLKKEKQDFDTKWINIYYKEMQK